MNERIKALAKKAGLQVEIIREAEGDVKCFLNASGQVPSVQSWEKFAELIVKECCDLLETSLPYNPQQKMIKKHFGVEE